MEWVLLCILFESTFSVGVVEVSVNRGELESGKRVGVYINWSCEESIDHYMVMKRRSGDEWHTISVFDFADGEPIRVLNAFPGLHMYENNILSVQMKYADGTSTIIEKSSALKIWMEGGSIEGEEFENVGRNPVTNDQFILVDLIRIEDLNSDPTLIWDYDVVVVGTWDGAGRYSGAGTPNFENRINVPSNQLCDEIRKYAVAGYGAIASHDTVSFATGASMGLGRIRDIFGVKVSNDWSNKWFGADEADEGLEGYRWRMNSEEVTVVKYGEVVDFPWTLSGRKFRVAMTHTCSNMATADVWIELTDRTNQYGTTLPPAIGNMYYYLTTKNNTAMIQTGHDNCNSTLDERKVWVNLIRHLKQRTNKTSRVDHSPVDEDPPTAPVCECCVDPNDEYIDIQCSSEDSSLYEYRVAGYDKNNSLVAESKTVEIDVGSGVSEYYILGTNSDSVDVSDIIASGVKSADGSFRLSKTSYVQRWFSVAVDLHGNISPASSFTRDVCRCPTDRINVYTKTTNIHARIYFCLYCLQLVNLL